jgi:hypothetical protein
LSGREARVAAGDLIYRDYQYEFRGLPMGSGTPYFVETVDGLLAAPDVKSSDESRDDDHGDFPGLDSLAGRRIQMSMKVLAESKEEMESCLDALQAAMSVSRRNPFVEYEFVTRRPGKGKRLMLVRARKCSFVSEYDVAHGKANGALEWYGTDPRVYSLGYRKKTLTIPSTLNTISDVLLIDGNFEDGMWPYLELGGPCVNPRISNLEDGNRQMKLDITLTAGQTLIIDVRSRTITLSGVDRTDVVRTDSEWFALLPGVNTLTYNRSGGGASSSLLVRGRDVWNSA